MNNHFQAWKEKTLLYFEKALEASFDFNNALCTFPKTTPDILLEAMKYSALSGGKRLRPLLVFAAGEVAKSSPAILCQLAIALEYVHVYSLIHDDLPAMDDDDLRRGKPSCHIVYGQANAILAGDALLTQSFAIIAKLNIAAENKIAMIQLLTEAAGAGGMVGGQVLDIASEKRAISLVDLENIHKLKTGALIKASVLGGALCGKVDLSQDKHLERYAEALGLAFQVSDDLLDVLVSSEELGKTAGKDEKQQKSTYPSMLGLDKSQATLDHLIELATDALSDFNEEADALRSIAQFVKQRKN